MLPVLVPPVKGSKISKCEGGEVRWWCQCELDKEIKILVDVMVWEKFLPVSCLVPWKPPSRTLLGPPLYRPCSRASWFGIVTGKLLWRIGRWWNASESGDKLPRPLVSLLPCGLSWPGKSVGCYFAPLSTEKQEYLRHSLRSFHSPEVLELLIEDRKGNYIVSALVYRNRSLDRWPCKVLDVLSYGWCLQWYSWVDGQYLFTCHFPFSLLRAMPFVGYWCISWNSFVTFRWRSILVVRMLSGCKDLYFGSFNPSSLVHLGALAG